MGDGTPPNGDGKDPASKLVSVWLTEERISQMGWPTVILVLILSGGANRVFDLAIELIKAGPFHFWSAVALVGGIFTFAALSRRQSRQLEMTSRSTRERLENRQSRRLADKLARKAQKNAPKEGQ